MLLACPVALTICGQAGSGQDYFLAQCFTSFALSGWDRSVLYAWLHFTSSVPSLGSMAPHVLSHPPHPHSHPCLCALWL